MGDAADDVFWSCERREMNDDDYITIRCVYKAKTNAAVLIAYKNQEHWVPRTCIHYKTDKLLEMLNRNDEFKLTVREWLAEQKGW